MKRSELVEIKRNTIGQGLLIEHDGHISITDGNNKQLVESFRGNEQWNVPYPFIVDAVFQKCDLQNANGRIYPERVLRKQVEVYQQKIKEKRAYGECYSPDVLILTEDGWKTLADVKEGENILTLNCETKEIEIQPIKKKIEYDYEGDMIRVNGRNINDLVTPNHGYPIFDDHNNFKNFYTAEDILNNNVPSKRHCFIPKQGNWNGLNDEYMILPQIDEKRINKISGQKLKEKYSQPLMIPMNIFAKFMGIYLSEGSFSKKGYRVNIHQKKELVCNEIEEMLNEWGINYTVNVDKNSKCKCFVISDMRLHKYVSQFGICYDKYVPFILKQQNKDILTTFYNWFVLGDGRQRGYGVTTDVFSTSKQMAYDLNEIQLKIGYSGNFHTEKRNNDRLINGRLIEGKNCHPMHFTMKSLTRGIYLDERFMKLSKEPYKGKVMCVEVENHTWYVMSNDKCHWTKNCNHPSDSTIDLGRIAINIVELHWENKTVVGKLEIITSEGFRKTGIISCLGDMCANLILNELKIGVSSRGIGSVENKLGKYVVGDDFELICWDVVSDPSTNQAWISTSREEIETYIEQKETDKNKILSEKLERVKDLLN